MIKNLTKFFSSFFLMTSMIFSSCTQDEQVLPNACDDPFSTETCFQITQDSFGMPAVRITDRGEGVGTRTFSSDTVYILENFVFVNNGQILTIEPGTIIRGESGTGTDASALVVARGGQIIANGTSSDPIIFTSTIDDLSTTTDLSADVNSLWGGLIILGNAPVTFSGTTERAIEGIPTTELRGLYGGNNPSDNSGVLRYVSIRHGGTEIGAGNEINGLTLGGVGSGTTIDYIEVFASFDDGIECFGGSVNIKHAIVGYVGDDCVDVDEGYQGNIQFLLVVQKPGFGNRGLELNGANNDDSYNQSTNLSNIMIGNATLIGALTPSSTENNAATFRQGCKGGVFNSIFYNFDKKFTVTDTSASEPYEAAYWLRNGGLDFDNNVFSSFTGASDLAGCVSPSNIVSLLTAASNLYFPSAPIQGVQVSPGSNRLNPLPTAATFTLPVHTPTGPFWEQANYIGAFSNTNWGENWSALSEYGIF